MLNGKTIRLYLVDGTSTGILKSEIINWTGSVLVAPRTELPKLAKRDEVKRTGVYMLVGDDPESPLKDRVYIGETDNIINRLLQHDKDENKDFWTRTVLISSKDANLTKAHVRYLENKLICLTKEAGVANLANGTSGTNPDVNSLPESDIADMEYFLSQVQLTLPVLGFNFTQPNLRVSDKSQDDDEAPVLVLNVRGAKARAKECDGKIVVFKGSTACKIGQPSWDSYVALYEGLVKEGKLIDSDNENYYVFSEDTSFNSTSAAGTVINAGTLSGPSSWKIEKTGQSYRDWKNSMVAEESN